jgi:hypothetical protein
MTNQATILARLGAEIDMKLLSDGSDIAKSVLVLLRDATPEMLTPIIEAGATERAALHAWQAAIDVVLNGAVSPGKNDAVLNAVRAGMRSVRRAAHDLGVSPDEVQMEVWGEIRQ